ncbi:hypothetical protein ACFL6S_17540 [Candidatus Poribacteria bacterium]
MVHSQRKLRKADFVTSIFLFALGLWICLKSLKMPMKDSFGGVQNVWYVSPALLPIIIGSALMLLSLMLFVNAVRAIGFVWIVKGANGKLNGIFRELTISEKALRFIAILILLSTFVFLNIPRIDFFLSSILFLLAFITMFYFGRRELLIRLLMFYSAGNGLFIVYFLLRLDGVMNSVYYFMTDVLALVFIIAYAAFAAFSIRGNMDLRRKLRFSVLTAIIAPAILCTVFKYFLLVPLPKEGIIVEGIMDFIRYSLH